MIGIVIPIPNYTPKYSASVYSSDGRLLSAVVSSEQQWCLPLKEALPEKLETCILMYEDEYYYRHLGVNPISIAKAFYTNIKANKIVRGGSTITMQVMRMKNKNASRSIKNKLIETVSALKYSILYSKKKVLREWANIAPFGGNTIGVQAASLMYFNRPITNLSWAEYALLAVLPNAPTSVNLKVNRDKLKAKRDRLLLKLHNHEHFSADDLHLYQDEDIPDALNRIPQHAYHLLQFFLKKNEVNEFHSTIDFSIQQKLNSLLETESGLLKQDDIQNVSAVIIDVENNQLLGYTGNVKSKEGVFKYMDLIQAQRSYGSLLKPLLYAQTIDQKFMLPKEMVADIPTHIGDFRPENFDKLYRGAVPLDEMVIQSLNVPAVRVLNSIGLQNFYQLIRRLNIKGLDRGADHYGLSLILGGGESSLWELSRIYKGMAQNYMGYSLPYKEVQTLVDKPIEDSNIDFAFSPQTMDAVANAMSDLTRPREEKSWELFGSDHKIAWKTGTSYGHKDAWAIGFSGKYVVGVWVGNETGEGRPRLTGVTRAAPIMFKAFSMLEDNTWFATAPQSSKIEKLTICSESGKLAGLFCKHRIVTRLESTSFKYKTCDFHKVVMLNDNNQMVNIDCAIGPIHKDTLFVLPSHMEYYYKKGHKEYLGLPQIALGCAPTSDDFSILYPTHKLKIFLPKESSSKTNKLVARGHHTGSGKLYWFIDDLYLQTSNGDLPYECVLDIGYGNHVLTITDEWGNSKKVEFEILEGD